MNKMKDKRKKLSKRIIALIVCAVFVGVLLLTFLGLQIAFVLADGIKLWRPDYEMIDIGDILDKDELSEKDYEILFEQTGLTKTGVDRALARGASGKSRILTIQENYFKDFEVINGHFKLNGYTVPLICTDWINGRAQAIYLENGDVILSSSTHISGYRMGHAGLVTDGDNGKVMQAMAYGDPTYVGNITDFTNRVNFMIFSVKTDSETKERVVQNALENYIGTEYSAFTGVFTDKNSIKKTQCAHLVWYAYNQFGIDLDSDGGLMVTPNDIANSPYLELVQVFGFNPYELW